MELYTFYVRPLFPIVMELPRERAGYWGVQHVCVNPEQGMVSTKHFLQKWQCVEDASGKLKLHKCKGMANLAAMGSSKGISNLMPKYYSRNSEDCNCEENEYKLSPIGRRKKLFSKKSK